jgi:uncharacterized protein (TIGR02186 family)
MSGHCWLAAAVALSVCQAPAALHAGTDSGQDQTISLHVSEQEILITPRYSGQRVSVSGVVANGCDVVVVLSSPDETVACSRMGKMGPFWLSRGRVRLTGAPAMYKAETSRPLQEILPLQQRLRYRLGFRGLRASMNVQGASDPDLLLNEFITLRRTAGLYASDQAGVTLEPAGRFATSFFFPAGAPSGRYDIEALAVRNMQVVGRQRVPLDVRAVGLEAIAGSFARSHGVLYGLFAVAMAVVIGYLMSLLTGLLGGRRGRPLEQAGRMGT